MQFSSTNVNGMRASAGRRALVAAYVQFPSIKRVGQTVKRRIRWTLCRLGECDASSAKERWEPK